MRLRPCGYETASYVSSVSTHMLARTDPASPAAIGLVVLAAPFTLSCPASSRPSAIAAG